MTITLATLAQATEQQIFDQVARHLLKQGKQAKNSDGACKYRTTDGLMCAAGCLIAEDEYSPDFEMLGSWPSVVRRKGDTVTPVHEYFITQLQQMHDRHALHDEPLDFAARLKLFARNHKLQFNLEELSK